MSEEDVKIAAVLNPPDIKEYWIKLTNGICWYIRDGKVVGCGHPSPHIETPPNESFRCRYCDINGNLACTKL